MAEEELVAESATTTTTEGSLLEQLLEEAKVTPDQETYSIARQGVEAFSSEVLTSSDKYRKIDKAAVDAMIAEIDQRLSAQVNEILHHPGFQKLETSWRSLKYLVDNVNFRENVRVEVMNCSKQDLLD